MKTKFSLPNKSVILTGGGSGIGNAIATTFAKQGAEVHILDFNLDAANNTVVEITKAGFKAKAYQCNVADFKQVSETVNQIAVSSSVDILINNAGIAHVGNIEVCEEVDLDRLYEINIKGVYNCLKVCIPIMKDNRGGVVLNMASIASTVGISDRFAYSMTKGAVLTMTYSIAKDYIDHNIRCNCISPARVHTPFVDGFIKKNYPGNEAEMYEKLSKTQPIGRMGKPQEVADLALFLCADEASFITGSNYGIDGGYITLNSK
ncbi:MAG: glucose 1-dehydrogenase [Flavobacteriaceae bacterium]|nr:glucose 1-dehydrogenase [Flavobacteriaceae bacterium]MDG2314198.1 glucose 1-dehydrogenase [Flavobacteriaceae bacterium]